MAELPLEGRDRRRGIAAVRSLWQRVRGLFGPRAPAPPRERSLIELVHRPYGPRVFVKPTGPRTAPVSVHSTGLFTDVAVTVETEWFWQYNCLSLVFFARDGVRAAYVPVWPTDEPPGTRLERLPCYRVDAPSRWLAFAQARFRALNERGIDPQLARPEVSNDEPAPDFDAAPWLTADLWRLARGDDDDRALVQALGVLDMLATFRGQGTDNVRVPAMVRTGESAVAYLASQFVGAEHERVRAALLAGPTPVAGTYRSQGVARAALIDRYEKRDGYVGGFDHVIALVTLTAWPDRWSYAREVLFTESEEGDAMT